MPFPSNACIAQFPSSAPEILSTQQGIIVHITQFENVPNFLQGYFLCRFRHLFSTFFSPSRLGRLIATHLQIPKRFSTVTRVRQSRDGFRMSCKNSDGPSIYGCTAACRVRNGCAAARHSLREQTAADGRS